MFALLSISQSANAAGVSKIFKISVDETRLQGYVPGPTPEWKRDVRYGAVTATTEAAQKIYALTTYTNAPQFGGHPLPPRSGITIIPINGAAQLKFWLPQQVTAQNCTTLLCFELDLMVSTSVVLPRKLIVFIRKVVPNSTGRKYDVWVYALDTDASTTASNRWTLIYSKLNDDSGSFYRSNSEQTSRFFVFDKRSISTSVFEVVNR